MRTHLWNIAAVACRDWYKSLLPDHVDHTNPDVADGQQGQATAQRTGEWQAQQEEQLRQQRNASITGVVGPVDLAALQQAMSGQLGALRGRLNATQAQAGGAPSVPANVQQGQAGAQQQPAVQQQQPAVQQQQQVQPSVQQQQQQNGQRQPGTQRQAGQQGGAQGGAGQAVAGQDAATTGTSRHARL